MFEVEPDDIAALSDGDLRTLIGRLCEAELLQAGFSPAYVTYGGKQDSSDGGVDVRVQLPPGSFVQGFLPHAQTVIQVKKPDLKPSQMREEMAPGGLLRPVIQELVEHLGAYIIVTSAALTDSQLRSRLEAMVKAVVNHHPFAGQLKLDLYDRSRISSWVRCHPGLLPWVRQRVGKPIYGWRSYHDWPTGDGEFLLDTSCRLKRPSQDQSTLQDGLADLRNGLRQPGQVVRLVGLSGVGKTRLAQALFDQRLGDAPLPSHHAIYADLGESPDPTPQHLLSALIARQQRAVVVVDNCGSELHGQLSRIATGQRSTVSLLTIEYDIREDLPESTQVWELEPASDELMEHLIALRRPDLGPVDRRRIASLSGGNARVAFALANALEQGRPSAELSDDQLFRRLFWQRHAVDQQLERSARALALVYSFQGVSTDKKGELQTLAHLADVSVDVLHQHVAELRGRQLIQERGHWRAILPHPIANRLATQALRYVPLQNIERLLVGAEPGRLAVSFCHRLGFLHECKQAVELAEQWLNPGQLLGTYPFADKVLRQMFFHLAPIAPGAWLAVLERSPGLAALGNESQLVSTVVAIAYEPALFDRAARLLIRISPPGRDLPKYQGRDSLRSLFKLQLSGTHAPAHQRLAFIESLMHPETPELHSLASELIGSFLQATHFVGSQSFQFGQHSRDFGYLPRTWADVKAWFEAGLQLAESLGNRSEPFSEHVRNLLAERFRGLWTHGACHDELERVCRSLRSRRFWPQVLPSLHKTLHYEGRSMPEPFRRRLQQLYLDLAPETLLERALDVLSNREQRWDTEMCSSHDEFAVGAEVAANPEVLHLVLSRLVTSVGGQLFANGLASRLQDPAATWSLLVQAYSAAPPSDRCAQSLGGFLAGAEERHPAFVQAALDAALTSDVLGPVFVQLQTSVRLQAAGIQRLRKAAELQLAPPQSFRQVTLWSAGSRVVADKHIAFLARRLATAGEEGFSAAVELLCWRIKRRKGDNAPIRNCLRAAGRSVLRRFSDPKGSDGLDYNLAVVARHCLEGADQASLARQLCRRLQAADALSMNQFPSLLESLTVRHPDTVLEELLGGSDEEFYWNAHGLTFLGSLRPSPLNTLAPDFLMSWAIKQVTPRCQRLAQVVDLFDRPSDAEALSWKPIALELLNASDAPQDLLAIYADRLRPRTWSGSLAQKMEDRVGLFDALATAVSPQHHSFIAAARQQFLLEIEAQRETERREQFERGERFE